jgi:hypothetical protein
MVSWAIGTDRFWSEIGRRRMNRDRAKSHARGQYDKSLRPEGAVNESAQAMKDLKEAITESRDNNRSGGSDKQYSRDDSSIDTSGTAGLDKMRKDFRIDKNPVASQGFKEAENIDNERAGSHLDSMRSSMGLDNPYAPESFDLDALPDLGKQTGAKNGNTVDNGSGSKGTTNITGTNSTTGTGRRSNTKTSTAGSQTTGNPTGGGRKRRASVYTARFTQKPPTTSVPTNPTGTVNTTAPVTHSTGVTNHTGPANTTGPVNSNITAPITGTANTTGPVTTGTGNVNTTGPVTTGTGTVNTTGPINNNTTGPTFTRTSNRNDTTGTVNTGNIGTRGTVGMTGNTGRDGRQGTDGVDGRNAINNTTQSAPNLTRERNLNNQTTQNTTTNPVDMKANLKARVNDRKNQQ